MLEKIVNILEVVLDLTGSSYAVISENRSGKYSELVEAGEASTELKLLFHSVLSDIKQEDNFAAEELLERYETHKSGFSLKKIEKIHSSSHSSEFILFLFSPEGESEFHPASIKEILNLLSTKIDLYLEEREIGLNGKKEFDIESLDEISPELGWREYFSQLFQTASDLVFVLNSEGIILSVNPQGAENLYYSVDELKGKHFLDIVDLEESEEVTSSLNYLLSKKTTSKFKAVLCSKYDELINYEVNLNPVVIDSEIKGVIGIGRNIAKETELLIKINDINPKLLEANRLLNLERTRSNYHKSMVEELNRLKGEFVSNISHELRTPLASIVGFSETIASDPNLPVELRSEFNKIILNEGKRLAKLINDVLDISRMESGVISLNISTFNAVELIHKTLKENKKEFSAHKLTLTTDIPFEEVIIEADNERLGKSLNAILDNAIKFTEPGGRIKVILNNLYREVEIIVSDTGIGIPEKDLPFIFQKFYRVERPDDEIGGTGMGLVFVKQIVDLHKGIISVQSEPNKGTTVSVKLLKKLK